MWSSLSRWGLSFVPGGSSLLWLFISDLGCSSVKYFIGQLVTDPGPLALVVCLKIRPTVAILKSLRAFQQPPSCLWGRTRSFPSQRFPASLWSLVSTGPETLGSQRGYCANCCLRTCSSSSEWGFAASSSCPRSFLRAHVDKTWPQEVAASLWLVPAWPSAQQQQFPCHISGVIMNLFLINSWLRGSLIWLHIEPRIPQGRSSRALDTSLCLLMSSLNWNPWGY